MVGTVVLVLHDATAGHTPGTDEYSSQSWKTCKEKYYRPKTTSTHSKVCIRNVSSSAEPGPSSDGRPLISNVSDAANKIVKNPNTDML